MHTKMGNSVILYVNTYNQRALPTFNTKDYGTQKRRRTHTIRKQQTLGRQASRTGQDQLLN